MSFRDNFGEHFFRQSFPVSTSSSNDWMDHHFSTSPPQQSPYNNSFMNSNMNQMLYFEVRQYVRVHLFRNGELKHGKALALCDEKLSLKQVCDLAAKKFNLIAEPIPLIQEAKNDEKKTPAKPRENLNSNQLDNQYLVPQYKSISLYTLKGSKIEDVSEIIHDDVLFIVEKDEEFIPPLPIENLLSIQQPHMRTRLTTLVRRAPLQNFFDSFAPELFFMVFSFLDHRDLGCTIALVNKQWNYFSNNQNLWKELCANVVYWREKRRRERRQQEEEEEALIESTRAALHLQTQQTASSNGPTGITQQQQSAQQATNPVGAASSQGSGNAANNSTIVVNSNRPNSLEIGSSLFFDKCRDIPLQSIRKKYMERQSPPHFKTWKAYFRYYILWAGAICWDTTEKGPNIKFKNGNRSVYRLDGITYHWQSVKANLGISIPSEKEKKKNGIFDGNADDIAIHEFEIYIEKFDKSHSNGWWIVFGLETDEFNFKESTPTNLIGYDRHVGFGFAAGNGDTLHCYSNQALKNRQQFTCDPIKTWCNTPFKEGDTVRARVKFHTKVCVDSVDPKEYIGASLEFFLNGRYLGQAFRNITGVVYPAISILPNQTIQLRNVDPILQE